MNTSLPISVAIPTYGRNQVLIETVEAVMQQERPPAEILIIDQTSKHETTAEHKLQGWHQLGKIKWRKLAIPCITRAMNIALGEALNDIVLFLDDDIIPLPGLIQGHLEAYQGLEQPWAVTGQVLQPGETPMEVAKEFTKRDCFVNLEFPFNSSTKCWVTNVMAGNLSVQRNLALKIGGFDENFVGVAYRFETEFCQRIWQNGGKVLYEPKAGIRHLRAAIGGTRRYGCHLTSASPLHGVGDYYFAIRQGISRKSLCYMTRRPLKEVCTRFHFKHPWWIPVKLFGEVRALFLAVSLNRQGPKLIGKMD